jgi:hypothetical protein
MTETNANPSAQPAPKLHKSIDLITSNTMHEILEAARLWERQFGTMPKPEQIAEDAARRLLCSISHGGRLELVFAALGAVGAPASAQECAQRLRAALEVGTTR